MNWGTHEKLEMKAQNHFPAAGKMVGENTHG